MQASRLSGMLQMHTSIGMPSHCHIEFLPVCEQNTICMSLRAFALQSTNRKCSDLAL